MTYGNGTYVAVASTGYGNRVMTSTNGTVWVNQVGVPDSRWFSVAYDGVGTWVAVGSGTGSGDFNRSMISLDNGMSWSLRQTGSNIDAQGWTGVTYGPADSLWVAVAGGGTGKWIMTSPTGSVWVQRNAPNANRWSSVAYGGGVFVAVGYSGTGNRVMTRCVSWSAGFAHHVYIHMHCPPS